MTEQELTEQEIYRRSPATRAGVMLVLAAIDVGWSRESVHGAIDAAWDVLAASTQPAQEPERYPMVDPPDPTIPKHRERAEREAGM